MIRNKNDLQEYLQSDKVALGRKENHPRITDYIWKYEILLRKCEYVNNCVKNPLVRFLWGGGNQIQKIYFRSKMWLLYTN